MSGLCSDSETFKTFDSSSVSSCVGDNPIATPKFSLLFSAIDNEGSPVERVKLPVTATLIPFLPTNESAEAACSVQATVIRFADEDDDGSRRDDVELDLRPGNIDEIGTEPIGKENIFNLEFIIIQLTFS